jgi:hypothetical protein
MDLPLIGDHKDSIAGKQGPETLVNLYIEGEGASAYLRSRNGYERYDRYSLTPGPPPDAGADIDNLTVSSGVGTADGTTSGIRYGYEIDDSIQINGATNTDWNGTWTITAVSSDGETFSFNESENSVTLVNEIGTGAGCIIPTVVYKKEVRLLQRYDNGTTLDVRAVIGNRVYDWTHASGWAEATTPQHRFISMNGAVSGEAMGDLLTDGIVLCDGVSAIGEGVASMTLTYTGGAWSSSALTTKSNTVAFMDGYIIRDDKANTGAFVYSDLYDASVENPFNFATAEGAHDDLYAVVSDRRELWLFGEHTTEVWYNVGDKDLPFQRGQGGFSETGIAAPLTAKKFDNSIMWLAQDRRGGTTVVRAGDGVQPIKISTTEIDHILRGRGEYLFNAHANVIRAAGHEFYILTIPGRYGITNPAPITLVYDSVSKVWARWESNAALLSSDDAGRFFMTSSVFMYDSDSHDNVDATSYKSYGLGTLVAGRDRSGEFYLLFGAIDEHADGDQGVTWERTLPAIVAPNKKRFGLGAVELETDEDAGGSGTYSLSYAKDKKTFTTPADRTVTASTSRLMWKKVGRACRWILRFSGTTAVNLPAELIKAVSTEPGDD